MDSKPSLTDILSPQWILKLIFAAEQLDMLFVPFHQGFQMAQFLQVSQMIPG